MRTIDADEFKSKLTDLIAIYESRMPKWSPNDPHTSGKDAAMKYGAKADGVEEALKLLDSTPTIHEETNTKAAAIMQHYGAKHQLLKLAEECAELTQQCMKCFDLDLSYSEDFVEELADVRIMIMQFESILLGSWGELYQKIIAEKLERQIRRINDE